MVSRAISPVRVDAILDEPAWKSALVIDLVYEWSPGDNAPPPVKTECLVAYDDDHLYVAFRAYDPQPGEIRAHLMDRDSLVAFLQDDHVGFFLDTFNDERRAYEFRLNPLGVQIDALYNELEASEDFSWDVIWYSAGQITEEGYVTEMAIPFRQIGLRQAHGDQTWGFEAFRSYPRWVRHQISSRYTDRDLVCTLCQINKVSGFRDIRPGFNLDLTPTLTVHRTDRRQEGAALEPGDEEVDPGLSARWSLTPAITLSAALNPDFSQVESDAAQLDVNHRFALVFPEKRPFFLEGVDIFSTPLQAVFTRTVVDPEWGLKLSGKASRYAFGLFGTHDEVNNLVLPSNQESILVSLDQEVDGSVFRVRRDLGQASTVGVLYTGRQGKGYHNHMAGLDGFFRLGSSNLVRFQALRSDTRYPDALALAHGQRIGPFRGAGLKLGYEHASRHWLGSAFYTDLDPGFRADAGFVPRVDARTLHGELQRIWQAEAGSWYTQLGVGGGAERTEDHDGRLTDSILWLAASYSGPLQSEATLDLQQRREMFEGVTYELENQDIYLRLRPYGGLSVELAATLGDAIDFANGRAADSVLLQPKVGLRLGKRFEAGLDHAYQRLEVAEGELFTANLSQVRLVYQANVRTFVRTILQYTDVRRNVDLYEERSEPRSEELFGQLLFSYKLNPQTVIFLGYSEDRLGSRDVPLDPEDRTFFFKLGYAFIL